MSTPWTERRRGSSTTFEIDAIRVLDRDPIAAPRARLSPVTCGAVVGVVFWTAWLCVMLQDYRHTVPAVLAVIALAAATHVLLRSHGAPKAQATRFTIHLGFGTLSIEGSGNTFVVDLAAIDRFEATRDAIELVRIDGERRALPFVLGDETRDRALASRLGDAVIEARAGDGYRGPGPEDSEPQQAQRRA